MTTQRLRLCSIAMMGLALAATANAEAIYRCGNRYSQTPCAEARVLQIDDSSNASRKKEVDAATRRDARLANTLERDRLQQEQASAAKKSPLKKAAKSRPAASQVAQDQRVMSKPKWLKSALHKPKYFTALVPGSEKNPDHAKQATKAKPAASK